MKFKILLFTTFLAFFSAQSYAQACAAYGYFTQSGATVTFNDTSYSANGHGSYWSFGDGASGYGSTTTYTYPNNGTYTASLYIFDSIANCDDTTFFSVTITTAANCNASFTFYEDSLNYLKYYFSGSNTPTGGTASWMFRKNGVTQGTASGQNTNFTFADTAYYQVTYFLYDSTGAVCDSTNSWLLVSPPPPSCYGSFSYSVDASNGYKLNFNNNSVGASAAYWWFGGTTYSSTYSPSYTFATTGYHTVCLTTYDSLNNICDSICQSVYVPGNPSSGNCDASFWTSVSGNTVSFYDSTNSSNIVVWSFGDASFSWVSNPVHTYSSAGTYNACLYVYDVDSVGDTLICDSFCQTITIAASNSCYGSFTYTADSSNPYTINFNNTSVGATSAYWWFGGSNSSTQYNPSFTFASSGYHTVCLTTYDSAGNFCDSICNSIYIADSSSSNCDASFTFVVDSMNTSASSYPVSFSHNSDTTLGFLWSFGDGSATGTSPFPTHVYTASGTYTVCLSVVTGYDSLSLPIICDSFCTTVTVGSTTGGCSPSFNFTVDSTNTNKYYFYGSTPPAGKYSFWHIYENGSLTTYNTKNAVHTFAGTGYIRAEYYMYNADSTFCDSTWQNITLSGANCQASYYLAVDTNNLYNLYIVNNSTGTTSTTNYYWTFGDGSSSTAQYPIHQYATFGLYELCLTISDSSSGCSSTHCDSIGLDSAGNLLKKDGFGITVVDEKDLLSVPKIDAIQGVSVYPNPSTGLYTVSVNMKASEKLSISATNSLGQNVLSQEFNTQSGANTLTLDMTEQPNGIYFINLRTGNEVKNLRVYLQK